jgi:hypothetical protein
MLLKYINSNRLSLILLFTLLPVIFWIPSFFLIDAVQVADKFEVPLGKWIILFNRDFRILASLVALLLVLANSYLLIQLNTAHIFIPFRTHLPSFFYVVLVVSVTQLHQLTPALVSSTLLILVFYSIFGAYKNDGISLNFLDAGLLVSTASLIYFPSLVFFFFLLAAISMLRPFIWREWVFALIGLLLPYIFILSGYYFFDRAISDFFKQIAGSFSRVTGDYKLSQIINWSYVLIIIMISSYYIAAYFDSMKIQARKFFMVFLVFFLFSVLAFVLIPGAGKCMVYFISPPLAYLFSYYFFKCKRNWINEILFALFLLLFLWQRL